MTAGSDGIGDPGQEARPTRRGVLLGVGAAGLTGLGALAGCSTAAVPYNANEAGVVDQASPASSGPASPMNSPMTGRTAGATKKPEQDAREPKGNGTVLGPASDIPVGGGKIFKAAKVVVTQPVRGQYLGFSAICTHVGCPLSEVAGGTIDCPCHGSEFTITTGAVVAGPAPRPLPRKKIKIVDGAVVLV